MYTPLLPFFFHLFVCQFEKFYTSKHNGRTLTWLHHHSQADLKLGYLKKPYTVCVTTYQMAVLCAYNEEDSYDLSTLCRHTQLSKEEIKSTLQTLVERGGFGWSKRGVHTQQRVFQQKDKVQNCSCSTEGDPASEEGERGGMACGGVCVMVIFVYRSLSHHCYT